MLSTVKGLGDSVYEKFEQLEDVSVMIQKTLFLIQNLATGIELKKRDYPRSSS